ncbi:serine hydrolase domain-containing protein [Inhella gelatinilytica]|uniref:Beta-lactamase family protein n=1 Tax=Inhella gelatinilytica TaxID=2795030 RepID=A0A931IVT5_9BURK|nr:serine hydrolase domain-containing protein [Inhella gelatinilytica]MBH9553750.1 beta-lactamase family protein [Inhella gelatinilytica]
MRASVLTPSRATLVVALTLAGCQLAFAAPAQPLSTYAEQLLDEQGVKKDGPGVVMLVAQGDKLLYQGARGMASIELGVPLSPEHRLRMGSVTKQFAAATLLKLVDEGKASLEDPLSKYLPDYPNGQAITLTQLLNHSSGVKSYTGIGGYMGNPVRSKLDTDEMIKVFKDLKPDFAPGQQYRYNNSGYVLLGAVIEAIERKPWHAALDAALLKPQRIDVRYPGDQGLVPGMAQGYSRGEEGELALATAISMTQPHAAGALVGDVQSLWRWNQALHGGKLLKPATYQRMITPEGAAATNRYGFGIGLDTLRGQPMLQHGGGIHGFVSLLVYQPASQITVALMANSDSAGVNLDLLARKLAAHALGKPYPLIKPVTVEVAALHKLEGVYSADGGKTSRTLRVIDGRLTSTRSGSQPIPLTPLGNDRFAFENSLAQAQIEKSTQGPVLAFFPDGDGEVQRWVKVAEVEKRAEVELNEAQRAALVGEFASPQLKLRIFVDAQGRLASQAPGQPVILLKAQSPRELFAVGLDATLSFSDEPGAAQSATLKQGPATLVLKRQ